LVILVWRIRLRQPSKSYLWGALKGFSALISELAGLPQVLPVLAAHKAKVRFIRHSSQIFALEKKRLNVHVPCKE